MAPGARLRYPPRCSRRRVHYRQLDVRGRTVLVFGSERFGLSPAWAQQGFRRVAIPMLGAADS